MVEPSAPRPGSITTRALTILILDSRKGQNGLSGHTDWSVTARHYARWTAGDHYVEPEKLGPGEVPADLLSRFSNELSPPQPAQVSESC